MPKLIYMDYHATTPVDPRVLRAMQPYFLRCFGNAASSHAAGNKARKAVEAARGEVAAFIGAKAHEIIFTSGATEANNMAIKGVAEACREKGSHFITVTTEHKSVLDPFRRLEMSGCEVTCLGVGSDGLLDLARLEQSLRPDTVLVSVMLANNEIGVLQPVAEAARLTHRKGALLHCDAAQALGKVPVDAGSLGADLLSFSAHKNYGPKGVGALYMRKSGQPQVKVLPLLEGGGHETGYRSGTLNVPGIVGFGQACRLSHRLLAAESRRVRRLRDILWKLLSKRIKGCHLNGSPDKRLPHNLNISIEGVSAKELMRKLPFLAISSGSACLSSSAEASYVLKAIGVKEELRHSSLRFGLGRFTTNTEIETAANSIEKAVQALRSATAKDSLS